MATETRTGIWLEGVRTLEGNPIPSDFALDGSQGYLLDSIHYFSDRAVRETLKVEPSETAS